MTILHIIKHSKQAIIYYKNTFKQFCYKNTIYTTRNNLMKTNIIKLSLKKSSFDKKSLFNKKKNNVKINNEKTNDENNAIIYARVSTLRQNTNGMDSLNTQIGICRHYSNKYNYNIISVFDEVMNGNDMLKLKISNIFNYSNINLIIADPSRLSRNPDQANEFIKKCISQNITIHFVRDNLIIGTSKTEDTFKKTMNLIKVAFMETETLKKRIRSTIKIKKELGSFFGKAPFGFDIGIENDLLTNIKIRKLVKNQFEQHIIEFINKMYKHEKIALFDVKILGSIDKKTIDEILKNKYDDDDKIAYLLNRCNILNKNKLWTKNAIKKLCKNG